jgi:hypothetical protein
VVRKEGEVIGIVLHWQGGDHTALQVKLRLNAAGRHLIGSYGSKRELPSSGPMSSSARQAVAYALASFVTKPDSCDAATASLFDHLVSAREQR